MERKMDFWTVEIATKFKDKSIVERLQKDLIDKFNYVCGKHKDYMAQVIIGVSNTNWHYVRGVYNERTGKCGKPKKIKDLLKEDNFTKQSYGSLNIGWHIHILALTSPSDTFARIIKNYIDKNWKEVSSTYIKHNDYLKNDINIGMLFYIAEQSDINMFFGNKDKRFDFSFKQMYEERVKKYTRLKFDNKYKTDEKYREKADRQYNEMVDYFNQFYDEDKKKKKEADYKRKIRSRKIAERYREMELRDNGNIVLKNNYDRSKGYDGFLGG